MLIRLAHDIIVLHTGFFCPWSGVVDCYRSMRSFERLTLNVRSKIQDPSQANTHTHTLKLCMLSYVLQS